MNREKAFQDFLNSFKVALNNTAVYFPEHPVFKKSIEDCKQKIELLVTFVNPVRIAFAPLSLFFNGKVFEKTQLYEDLSRFFHFRKIKSIEIKKGVSLEALINFFLNVSKSPREIFKKGVIESIVKKESVSSIRVEVLDYSQFLCTDWGEEGKDVWACLFNTIMSEEDTLKIDHLADNFEEVIGRLKSSDLIEHEELHYSMVKFLGYLQSKEHQKFIKCSKAVMRLILKDRNISREAMLERARAFFRGLNAEQLADTLWQEIVGNDNFNSLSFGLFSTLIRDGKQHEQIATSLADKFKKDKRVVDSPRVRKKIEDLFLSANASVPEVYRSTLSILLKELTTSKVGQALLDAHSVHSSYRFLILNLLAQERNRSRLALLSEKLLAEWPFVTADSDMEFLKVFLVTMQQKANDVSFANTFEPLKTRALNFIENALLEEENSLGIECVTDFLTNSSLSADVYFNKIFKEHKVRASILRLFFRFYSGRMPDFYALLQKKAKDGVFLKAMMDSLKEVHLALSAEILKYIYSLGGNFVKKEILIAMRQMPIRDENFLFSVLKENNVLLRKEAFLLILNDPVSMKKALELLLCIPNPFGVRNKILQENIEIAAEAKATQETLSYLTLLSKKRFFWNREVREKAHAAFMKLNARKF